MSLKSTGSADQISPSLVLTLISEAAKQSRRGLKACAQSFAANGRELTFFLTPGLPPNPTKEDLYTLHSWESDIVPLSQNTPADQYRRLRLTFALSQTISNILNHLTCDNPRSLPPVSKMSWQVDTRCVYGPDPAPGDPSQRRRYYKVRVINVPDNPLDPSMLGTISSAGASAEAPADSVLRGIICAAANAVDPAFSVRAHSFANTNSGIEMQVSLYDEQSRQEVDPTLSPLCEWERTVSALVSSAPRDKESRKMLKAAMSASLRAMKYHYDAGYTTDLKNQSCGDWEVRSAFQLVNSMGDSGETQPSRFYWLCVKSR